MDLRQIKVGSDDFGLMAYDPRLHEHGLVPQRDHLHRRRGGDPAAPGLPDRAAVRALDLPRGRLPAHQRGRWPTRSELQNWVAGDHDPHVRARERQGLHARISLRREPDGNAGGLGGSPLDLLSGRQPDPRRGRSRHADHQACWRRCRPWPPSPSGTTWASPTSIRTTTSTTRGNFLSMMYKMTELEYEPDPRLERALDVLFILHADHEQNASTSAVRSVGSTQVDPYTAVAAGRRGTLRPRCTAAPTRRRCGCSSGSVASRTSPASSRA